MIPTCLNGVCHLRLISIDLHPDKSGFDPKLVGTNVSTFNPPLGGELKVNRSAGGHLLFNIKTNLHFVK
jgi:hypothetical protein